MLKKIIPGLLAIGAVLCSLSASPLEAANSPKRVRCCCPVLNDFAVIEDPAGGATEAILPLYSSERYNALCLTNPVTPEYPTLDLGTLFPFNNKFYVDNYKATGGFPAPQPSNSLGNDSGSCLLTKIFANQSNANEGSTYECHWTNNITASINGNGVGSIMVEGPFTDFNDSTLAITGGTGYFVGAKGELVVTPIYRDSQGNVKYGVNALTDTTLYDCRLTTYRYAFHFSK